MPIDEQVKPCEKSHRGKLSRYSNENLQPLESEAWINEAKEKHEHFLLENDIKKKSCP